MAKRFGKAASDEDDADCGFGKEDVGDNACYEESNEHLIEKVLIQKRVARRTRAPSCQTPVLLFHDEALQPSEGASCLPSEDELKVENMSVFEQTFPQLRSMAVDFEDGKYDCIGNVSL